MWVKYIVARAVVLSRKTALHFYLEANWRQPTDLRVAIFEAHKSWACPKVHWLIYKMVCNSIRCKEKAKLTHTIQLFRLFELMTNDLSGLYEE